MAKIITVAIRKGGAGKTTTATNLATVLHQKGKKVLLVDLDPGADATASVGIDPLSLDKHLNTLFVDYNAQPQEVIVKTGFGLSVLPSHPSLDETEKGMKASQVGLLRGIVEPIRDQFDFIVFDTQPSESLLTVSAFGVSDEVVIPFQTHYLAMRGVQDLITEVENVKRGLNKTLRVAGILPLMVNARTNVSKTMMETVRAQYGKLVYPFQVDFSIRHVEATLAGEPIVLYDPQHQGSLAYVQLARTFLKARG